MALPVFGAVDATIHSEAATCRLMQQMDQACWQVCVQCHLATNPILPLDIYITGDAHLCAECHPDQLSQQRGNDFLLYRVGGGGGNHSFNIYYDPETSRTKLDPNPRGPKLFTDPAGNNPKVHCSSCHDSMAATPMLLRTSNRGSNLCLACHRK